MLEHCSGSSGPLELSNVFACAGCSPMVTRAMRARSCMTRLILVRYIIFSYERFCIPTEEVAEARHVLPSTTKNFESLLRTAEPPATAGGTDLIFERSIIK